MVWVKFCHFLSSPEANLGYTTIFAEIGLREAPLTFFQTNDKIDLEADLGAAFLIFRHFVISSPTAHAAHPERSDCCVVGRHFVIAL